MLTSESGNPNGDEMVVACQPTDISWNDMGSDIRSYLDFEGAKVTVSFETRGVSLRYNVGNFWITSKKGHTIVVSFEAKDFEEHPLPYFVGKAKVSH